MMARSSTAVALELGRPAAAGLEKRRALIVGGGLAGLAAARELRKRFRVTVVDAKEFFEFTPGILRAYSRPSHWDSLVFMYHQVLEHVWRVRFIWGEVLEVDAEQKCVRLKSMFARAEDVVPFDYCVISGGCNFDPLAPTGESPWFPSVHYECDAARSLRRHLDERFLEGRRRRILEEHLHLQQLNQMQSAVLIVGAGYTGVEWACELRHFFPGLRVTISDFLPRCLGPLPEEAATYCEEYMTSHGISTRYGLKFDHQNPAFWEKVGLPNGAEMVYVLSGVKHSNYFMPRDTLSERGPGGGGWILINRHLQVVTKHGRVWGDGSVFSVGDCSVGCVGEAPNYDIPPVPKTGYPAEQHAVHACCSIRALDRARFPAAPSDSAAAASSALPSTMSAGASGVSSSFFPSLKASWYPWGAGIYAISLGPQDGCVVIGTGDERGSGRLWAKGVTAAAQKELIEQTKISQCRGDHLFSHFIWYLVHHWPINLCGRGPLISA